jgi:(p)ppGpp synthase/HD superfamily hydrolase
LGVDAQAATPTQRAGAHPLTDRFIDALEYATRAHDGQIRGSDGQPYIAHLLRVAGLVIQDGGSEDEAIAALLHDAVEDQGGCERLDDIRGRFGRAVAEIVDECTDSYGDPKPPWRRRKEQYIDELPDASRGALLVSIADKLDNVRSMVRGYRIRGERQWARTGKSREDVRWYYGTLAERFCELRPGPLSGELAGAVAELERLIHGGSDAGR